MAGAYNLGTGGPSWNGIPMLGGDGLVITTGKSFWVGSTTYTTRGANCSDNNTGRSPAQAFSTLEKALGMTVDGQGDVIYLMPGFTENITAAGTITMSTSGTQIVGLGIGRLRPTLYFTTAAAATLIASAADCKISNVYMDMTKVNALVKPLDIRADGFWLDNCEIYFAKTSYVAGVVASTNASTINRLSITNCNIHGDAVASCTNAFQVLGGDNHVFYNNKITGNFTANLGCINNPTPGVCTDITIANNILENRTALATKVIVLYTGNTGRIVNNRMIFASTGNGITADGCWVGGNYYASAAATAGTLL